MQNQIKYLQGLVQGKQVTELAAVALSDITFQATKDFLRDFSAKPDINPLLKKIAKKENASSLCIQLFTALIHHVHSNTETATYAAVCIIQLLQHRTSNTHVSAAIQQLGQTKNLDDIVQQPLANFFIKKAHVENTVSLAHLILAAVFLLHSQSNHRTTPQTIALDLFNKLQSQNIPQHLYGTIAICYAALLAKILLPNTDSISWTPNLSEILEACYWPTVKALCSIAQPNAQDQTNKSHSLKLLVALLDVTRHQPSTEEEGVSDFQRAALLALATIAQIRITTKQQATDILNSFFNDTIDIGLALPIQVREAYTFSHQYQDKINTVEKVQTLQDPKSILLSTIAEFSKPLKTLVTKLAPHLTLEQRKKFAKKLQEINKGLINAAFEFLAINLDGRDRKSFEEDATVMLGVSTSLRATVDMIKRCKPRREQTDGDSKACAEACQEMTVQTKQHLIQQADTFLATKIENIASRLSAEFEEKLQFREPGDPGQLARHSQELLTFFKEWLNTHHKIENSTSFTMLSVGLGQETVSHTTYSVHSPESRTETYKQTLFLTLQNARSTLRDRCCDNMVASLGTLIRHSQTLSKSYPDSIKTTELGKFNGLLQNMGTLLQMLISQQPEKLGSILSAIESLLPASNPSKLTNPEAMQFRMGACLLLTALEELNRLDFSKSATDLTDLSPQISRLVGAVTKNSKKALISRPGRLYGYRPEPAFVDQDVRTLTTFHSALSTKFTQSHTMPTTAATAEAASQPKPHKEQASETPIPVATSPTAVAAAAPTHHTTPPTSTSKASSSPQPAQSASMPTSHPKIPAAAALSASKKSSDGSEALPGEHLAPTPAASIPAPAPVASVPDQAESSSDGKKQSTRAALLAQIQAPSITLKKATARTIADQPLTPSNKAKTKSKWATVVVQGDKSDTTPKSANTQEQQRLVMSSATLMGSLSKLRSSQSGLNQKPAPPIEKAASLLNKAWEQILNHEANDEDWDEELPAKPFLKAFLNDNIYEAIRKSSEPFTLLTFTYKNEEVPVSTQASQYSTQRVCDIFCGLLFQLYNKKGSDAVAALLNDCDGMTASNKQATTLLSKTLKQLKTESFKSLKKELLESDSSLEETIKTRLNTNPNVSSSGPAPSASMPSP